MPTQYNALLESIDRLQEYVEIDSPCNFRSQLMQGAIHQFQIAFELTKRFLRAEAKIDRGDPASIHRMDFSTVIRVSIDRSIVEASWPVWRRWSDIAEFPTTTGNSENMEKAIKEIGLFIEEIRRIISKFSLNHNYEIARQAEISRV